MIDTRQYSLIYMTRLGYQVVGFITASTLKPHRYCLDHELGGCSLTLFQARALDFQAGSVGSAFRLLNLSFWLCPNLQDIKGEGRSRDSPFSSADVDESRLSSPPIQAVDWLADM